MSNVRFSRSGGLPPVVKNLIIINVLVWVAQLIYDRPGALNTSEPDALTHILGLYPINSSEFKPYQIATHMFAHASYVGGQIFFWHILFNMFGLFMFGRILESVWGAKRFLFFYLSCGVGAAIVHLAMQYFMGGDAYAVGASGAIMGIFAAFAYLFPNTQLMIIPIPIPIKAKWVVLGYVLIDLFGGVAAGTGTGSGDNVAHFAHLGGALTGFLIVFFWNKTNKKTLY